MIRIIIMFAFRHSIQIYQKYWLYKRCLVFLLLKELSINSWDPLFRVVNTAILINNFADMTSEKKVNIKNADMSEDMQQGRHLLRQNSQ